LENERLPEEIRIAKSLTLKDYYDLRDLRLLLWTLESELCGKYGVSKACEVATRLKPVIEAKLRELEAKL
jgi:hypothetical protein